MSDAPTCWIERADSEAGAGADGASAMLLPVKERKTHSGFAAKCNPDYVRFCNLLTDARVSDQKFQEALTREQGTDEWLKDRKLHVVFDGWPVVVSRFSGSTVSCHMGVNKYKSGRKHSKEMVYGSTFDGSKNPACMWGHGAEPWAENAFRTWIKTSIGETHKASGLPIVDVRLDNYGMVLMKKCARRGYSPDGVLVWTLRKPDGTTVEEKELVEYKCPWGKRDVRDFTSEDMYPGGPVKKLESVSVPIPPMYVAQEMYGMYVMKRAGILTRRVSHHVTWFPAHDVDPDDPERPIYAVLDSESEGSVNVQTFPHGAFQYTRLEFNADYVQALLKSCEKNWRALVLPMLWQKLLADQRSALITAPVSQAGSASPDDLPWLTPIESTPPLVAPVAPPMPLMSPTNATQAKNKKRRRRSKMDEEDASPVVIPPLPTTRTKRKAGAALSGSGNATAPTPTEAKRICVPAWMIGDGV